MIEIINKILDKMESISKSQKKFIGSIFRAIVASEFGVNFRNLSRYSDYHEKTISRNFRKAFDFVKFNTLGISSVIPKGTKSVGAFDPSFIEKSGKKTYGKDKFWNGSNNKAESGLEASSVAIIDIEKNKAYPLAIKQTPTLLYIKQLLSGPGNIEIDDISRIDFYITFIASIIGSILQFTDYFVVDGFFQKEKFVTAMVNLGLKLVGKLRIDANLRYCTIAEKTGKRGRPKVYGNKFDINDLSKLEQSKFDDEITMYSGIVWSITLKRKIKIVVCVKARAKEKTSQAILYSTDLELSAMDIVKYYKARFQIEFVFRDAKQFTGLNDCQATKKESLDFHFNASMSSLLVIKLLDDQTGKNETFSMASYKRIYYNEILIGRFFQMFGFDQTSIKSDPKFNDIINHGVIFT